MRHLIVCAVLILTGCAAEVGKDKSGDLANENTNLKVQIAQLKLDAGQSKERAESSQKALDACYRSSK